jgi:hypothetical protein
VARCNILCLCLLFLRSCLCLSVLFVASFLLEANYIVILVLLGSRARWLTSQARQFAFFGGGLVRRGRSSSSSTALSSTIKSCASPRPPRHHRPPGDPLEPVVVNDLCHRIATCSTTPNPETKLDGLLSGFVLQITTCYLLFVGRTTIVGHVPKGDVHPISGYQPYPLDTVALICCNDYSKQHKDSHCGGRVVRRNVRLILCIQLG